MKLCRHGEVVYKATSLQGFLNSGYAVRDRGPSNNIDITVLKLYLHLYCLGISKSLRTRYLYGGRLWKRLSRRRRVSHCLWVASRARVNMMRNTFSESAPSVAVLVKPSSSMAAVLNALTPLTRKSDRIDAEFGDRSQSHTLRFGKCL